MKKVAIFLGIVTALVIPVISFAATATISNASGDPSQTAISVPIIVGSVGSAQITNMDLWFTYDPNLVQAVSVDKGSAVSAWSITSNTSLSGEVRIALYYSLALPSIGGEVARVVFNVKSTAQQGGSSPLHFTKAAFGDSLTGTTNDGAFTINSVTAYTLNLTNANGSVAKSPNKTTYSSGEVVTLTATANTGYHFVNWSGDLTGTINPTTVTISSNKSVTANFATNATYTITVTQGANGAISPSGSVAVNSGANQSFTITANTGYHVASVTADGSSVGAVTSYTFSNVTANHTITAVFEANPVNTYILSLTNANGSITKSPNKTTYNAGEVVTLTATANAGYHFANWSGDVTGTTNPTTITMSGNKSVTANFAVDGSTCVLLGDMNGDALINNFDITPFVTALTDPVKFTQTYPNINYSYAGDINQDGVFNDFDITPFVNFLTTPTGPLYNCPGALIVVSPTPTPPPKTPNTYTGIPAGFTFTRNIPLGTVSQDVVYLKAVLIGEGCGAGITSTTYYGPRTLANVQCFQNKYRSEISAFAGYTIKSSGLVGTGTRTQLNYLVFTGGR